MKAHPEHRGNGPSARELFPESLRRILSQNLETGLPIIWSEHLTFGTVVIDELVGTILEKWFAHNDWNITEPISDEFLHAFEYDLQTYLIRPQLARYMVICKRILKG